MTKVSFIIPSFNCAHFLPHAVKSVLDQTHGDIEIVIVDDASTDTTGEYLEWLAAQKDHRIKIIRNDENMGRSESRNIGNRAASGDIICVLDADDLAVATRAEWTIKKMKNGTKVVFGSAVAMDALGNALNEIPANPINKTAIKDTMENGIVHSTMAYTKEIANKYPYASGDICKLGVDDWHFQTRLLADDVSFDHITDVICAYRITDMGISNTRNPEEVKKLKTAILEGMTLEAVK